MEKKDLTLLTESITSFAKENRVFDAEAVKLAFRIVYWREPDSRAVGQAFRICSKNKVIVKVAPVQSQGQGRNGSLVWSWKGV